MMNNACTLTQSSVQQQTGKTNVDAVIVAAGAGERFGDARGKQYVELCGLPLLIWTLMAFDRAPSIGRIVIVCPPNRVEETSTLVQRYNVRMRTACCYIAGGSSRQESVARALSALDATSDLVAIHDGARPLVTADAIEAVIAAVRTSSTLAGAIAATPATDTLKLVEDKTIVATPNRAYYWLALTPQVFRTTLLRHAHNEAHNDGFMGTDDASLVERMGGRIRCVATSRDNIKVTVPEDLVIAEAILRRRLAIEGSFAGCDKGDIHA